MQTDVFETWCKRRVEQWIEDHFLPTVLVVYVPDPEKLGCHEVCDCRGECMLVWYDLPKKQICVS